MAKAKKQKMEDLNELPEEIAAQAAGADLDLSAIAEAVMEGMDDTDAMVDEAAAELAEVQDSEAEADSMDDSDASDEDDGDMPAITQDDLRLVEAILFASSSSVTIQQIAERFPEDRVKLIPDILEMLKEHYAARGVTLVQRDRRWALRTAADLGDQMRLEKEQPKKFTRAAMETLAIIAYHQPVTRAEIENIRGVATSPGALDTLMEAGWIKPGKRREVPGRPVTWLSTQSFLDHFGLEKLEDLPGMEELKAAGLLDKRPAIEAMPTADLFGDGEEREDIDPNEITDEDLIGQSDSDDEEDEDFDAEMETADDVDQGDDMDDEDDAFSETVSSGGDDDADDDADDMDDEDGDDADFDDEDDDGDSDDDGDFDDDDEDDEDADEDFDDEDDEEERN
jgi:segregation and condensation protein B